MSANAFTECVKIEAATAKMCVWSGWMLSKKRSSTRLFNKWSKGWYEIHVVSGCKNKSFQEDRRIHFYHYQDNARTRAETQAAPELPSKIIVVDPEKKIYPLMHKDKTGRFCVSVGVKGYCGKVEGLKEGRIVLALETEDERLGCLQLLHELLPRTDYDASLDFLEGASSGAVQFTGTMPTSLDGVSFAQSQEGDAKTTFSHRSLNRDSKLSNGSGRSWSA
mmetsp:Transcript_45024/g.119751  ORF Transcript_45024/g.119751 Transcript_45024/m.119751 type:complete len:221 (+) Transcript_45024:3-665(+)